MGDLGSPFYCYEDGKWSQFGIVSEVAGCQFYERPLKLTKITQVTSWVKSVISGEIFNPLIPEEGSEQKSNKQKYIWSASGAVASNNYPLGVSSEKSETFYLSNAKAGSYRFSIVDLDLDNCSDRIGSFSREIKSKYNLYPHTTRADEGSKFLSRQINSK